MNKRFDAHGLIEYYGATQDPTPEQFDLFAAYADDLAYELNHYYSYLEDEEEIDSQELDAFITMYFNTFV